VKKEETHAEGQVLLLHLEMGVAEANEDCEGDDAERGKRTEQGSGVRSAGEEKYVRQEQAGEEEETP
jgi:hypothetical protein